MRSDVLLRLGCWVATASVLLSAIALAIDAPPLFLASVVVCVVALALSLALLFKR